MAGNDVYLYSVPSDPDQDDVRLRDPTTAAAEIVTLALSVTEAQDSFAGAVAATLGLVLSVTETPDTFAGSVASLTDVTLAATEAQDSFAGTVGATVGLALAVTEAPDSFAGLAIIEDVPAATAPAIEPVASSWGGDYSGHAPRDQTFVAYREPEKEKRRKKQRPTATEAEPAAEEPADAPAVLNCIASISEAPDTFTGGIEIRAANDDEEAIAMILLLAA